MGAVGFVKVAVGISLRCVSLGMLFALSFGIGQYALAPDGTYDNFALEKISYDPHAYYWGILVPQLWYMIAAHATLFAWPYYLIAAAVASIIAGVLIFLFPAEGRRFWRVPLWALSLLVIVVGFVAGLLATMLSGRNPGVI